MTNRRGFFGWLAVSPVAAVGAVKMASVPTAKPLGDTFIKMTVPLPSPSPEQWLEWWDKNKAGIRLRVADQVDSIQRDLIAKGQRPIH